MGAQSVKFGFKKFFELIIFKPCQPKTGFWAATTSSLHLWFICGFYSRNLTVQAVCRKIYFWKFIPGGKIESGSGIFDSFSSVISENPAKIGFIFSHFTIFSFMELKV